MPQVCKWFKCVRFVCRHFNNDVVMSIFLNPLSLILKSTSLDSGHPTVLTPNADTRAEALVANIATKRYEITFFDTDYYLSTFD